MARKRVKYSNEFKVKLVLEVLKNEKTLNQIAKEHSVAYYSTVSKMVYDFFGEIR